MKTEAEVSVFVDGVLHYFVTSVQQVAECGTPYLALNRTPEISDYTGMIRITGKREGVVFFTAPKSMLCVMLMRDGETDMEPRQPAGDWTWRDRKHALPVYARGRDFGHQFRISVPSVVHGREAAVDYPANSRPIVIPIEWRTYPARLVVCLN